jgi:hypothetical protein
MTAGASYAAQPIAGSALPASLQLVGPCTVTSCWSAPQPGVEWAMLAIQTGHLAHRAARNREPRFAPKGSPKPMAHPGDSMVRLAGAQVLPSMKHRGVTGPIGDGAVPLPG